MRQGARLELRDIRRAEERLLAVLHLRAEADAMVIAGTWKDLAAELGLTQEALYRALSRLEQRGAIIRPATRTVLLRSC